MLEQAERRVGRKHGQIKHTRLADHIVREICLVDSDGNALGRVGKLRGGVDDAAVVLFAVAGRQDEQAVGEREECVLFNRRVGLMLCRSRLWHGIENGLRHSVNVRQLGLLERGLDCDCLVENCAVLKFLELRTHQPCGRRRPGAVFH